ncbi:hypothetical protein ACFC6L_10995 [Kitasatospora phosalacinea]|uniref:hypothetical protein n=1 Tax=Kitasatospora phosalacinea TaxID=2065 RepID=UPI0035D95C8B
MDVRPGQGRRGRVAQPDRLLEAARRLVREQGAQPGRVRRIGDAEQPDGGGPFGPPAPSGTVFLADCPARLAVEVITGKWAVAALTAWARTYGGAVVDFQEASREGS